VQIFDAEDFSVLVGGEVGASDVLLNTTITEEELSPNRSVSG
jgi:hypothetical protein